MLQQAQNILLNVILKQYITNGIYGNKTNTSKTVLKVAGVDAVRMWRQTVPGSRTRNGVTAPGY